MPRSIERIMNLRGPFGGLKSAAGPRMAGPLDCIDCLNVSTINGTIETRPGATIWRGASTADITKMFAARIGSSPYLYVWNGDGTAAGGHALLDASGTSVVAENIASTTRTPSVTQAKDRVYAVNGDPATESRKLYANGGSWYSHRLGIVAPPPLSIVAIAGVLTGNYSWRVTYWNDRAGVESGPSDEKTNNGAAFSLNLSLLASADPQVTHIRIYRKAIASDSTWFFVAQTTNATGVFNDNTPDANINRGIADQINLVVEAPPVSDVCCFHRSCMFYKDGLDGSDLLFSEIDRLEQVDSENSRLHCGDRDGNPITAMVSLGGQAVVFKRRSIWYVAGLSPSTFSSDVLARNVGLIARDGIAVVGGDVYFVSTRGLYVIRGGFSEPMYLGRPVEDAWRLFDAAYRDSMSICHNEAMGLLAITGRRTGSGKYDAQLVYDYVRDQWFMWDLPARCVVEWASSDSNIRSLFYAVSNANATHDRKIAVLEHPHAGVGVDYGADAIPWRWRTSQLDGGNRRPKRFFYMGAAWEQGTAADALAFKTQVGNGGLTAAGTGMLNAADSNASFRVGRRRETISIEASGSATARTRLSALYVDGYTIGRR